MQMVTLLAELVGERKNYLPMHFLWLFGLSFVLFRFPILGDTIQTLIIQINSFPKAQLLSMWCHCHARSNSIRYFKLWAQALAVLFFLKKASLQCVPVNTYYNHTGTHTAARSLCQDRYTVSGSRKFQNLKQTSTLSDAEDENR